MTVHVCTACGIAWQCPHVVCQLQAHTRCFTCSIMNPSTYSGNDIRWSSIDEAQEISEEDMEKTLFYIKVKSNFIPTMTAVKQKLGVGHEVVSVEGVKDFPGGITNTETALGAIINTGYKELIRRYHPDVAVKVDPDVIRHLTVAKKQLDELLKRIA